MTAFCDWNSSHKKVFYCDTEPFRQFTFGTDTQTNDFDDLQFEKHWKVFLSSFVKKPLPMSTRKKGSCIRLPPPPTRKTNTKHSHGEEGTTLPESEFGDVDQDTEDDDTEEHNVPIDMVSFQKQFVKMPK